MAPGCADRTGTGRTGTPIIFFHACLRCPLPDIFTAITWYNEEQNRYMFRAQDHLPSGDDVTDAATLNRIIEQMLREHPAQYMWSLRLFQTLPDGLRPALQNERQSRLWSQAPT